MIATVTASAFDALHAVVIGDPDAQARLRSVPDWEHFVAAAQEVGAEHGIHVSREDLEHARAAARQATIEREI